jgi:phosphatidylserine/phosphatidylglycerophosphate/cardiolipin synthase-like enzyme
LIARFTAVLRKHRADLQRSQPVIAPGTLRILSRFLLLYLLTITPVCAAEPRLEDAFSPHAGAQALILRGITDARHSIHVAAYTFTSWPIAHALADAARRGVDVRIVLDQSQQPINARIMRFFLTHGVATRADGLYAIMHDKFMVIDGDTLELGSFNYTQSAESRNAENVLVITGAPRTAADYERQWERLWGESKE